MSDVIGDIIRDQISDEITLAVDLLGRGVAAEGVTGLPGAVQSYARYVCRAWARSPTLSSDGKMFGINTACTDYLQSINQDPIPGSLDGIGPGTFVSGTGFANAGAGNCGPGAMFDFTATEAVEAYPNTFGQCDGTSFRLRSNGNVYNRQADAFIPGGPAFVAGVWSATGGTPAIQPPTPRPGLPPLGDPPDYPSIFGDLDVDIELRPDGQICIEVAQLGVTCIDPIPDDGRPPGGGNNVARPNIQPEQTLPDGGGQVEPPEGEVIIYARLRLTSIPTPTPTVRSSVFDTAVSGQQAFFPGIGYIKFEVPSGGFEGPYDVQIDDDVFPCFTRTGAVSAVIDLPPGVVATVELGTLPE